ncbi:hypothetical protein SKZ59_03060 [Janthinobacterium sp. GMG2]|uniref:hypothetical protein n=1 Tax=Janthinobacterium TaxID=29580 RepID=UPI00190FB388|nr:MULTISPECIES: hypothetical protein [Janthinobacterium]MDX8120742.1 hypothetical protein [Janthinobacterium sp. GMG2]
MHRIGRLAYKIAHSCTAGLNHAMEPSACDPIRQKTLIGLVPRAHLRLLVRQLAFFHLLDNAQFKSQAVISLTAPKSLFHRTLLLCIEKVSTYSRMGQSQKKA